MTSISFARALSLSHDSGLFWHSKMSAASFARDVVEYLDTLPEPGWVRFTVVPSHPYFDEAGVALVWSIGRQLAETNASYRLCDYTVVTQTDVTVVVLCIREVGLVDLAGN